MLASQKLAVAGNKYLTVFLLLNTTRTYEAHRKLVIISG